MRRRPSLGDEHLPERGHHLARRLHRARRRRRARRASRAPRSPRRRAPSRPCVMVGVDVVDAGGTRCRSRTRPRRAARSRRPPGRTRRASGSRMPAPSPVSGSAPAAPRWLRQHTAVSAWSTIAWLLRPFMSTTKPTPHAVVLEAGVVEPDRRQVGFACSRVRSRSATLRSSSVSGGQLVVRLYGSRPPRDDIGPSAEPSELTGRRSAVSRHRDPRPSGSRGPARGRRAGRGRWLHPEGHRFPRARRGGRRGGRLPCSGRSRSRRRRGRSRRTAPVEVRRAEVGPRAVRTLEPRLGAGARVRRLASSKRQSPDGHIAQVRAAQLDRSTPGSRRDAPGANAASEKSQPERSQRTSSTSTSRARANVVARAGGRRPPARRPLRRRRRARVGRIRAGRRRSRRYPACRCRRHACGFDLRPSNNGCRVAKLSGPPDLRLARYFRASRPLARPQVPPCPLPLPLRALRASSIAGRTRRP